MRRPVRLPLLALLAICAVRAQPADCTISARLDDAAGLIRGSETVRYHNLTRDTLGSLWFHFYADAFRDRSTTWARELEAMGRFSFSLARKRDLGWSKVDWVESGGRVTLVTEAETEIGLFLNPPLAPGESLSVSLGFRTRVSSPFGELAHQGRSFVLAHWFPEIAARAPDDGWLAGGYHVFGHSPSAFADYHVTLDLASDLDLAATGSVADSGAAEAGLGTRTVRIEAADVSGSAIVVAPWMNAMSRSISGVDITVLARSFSGPVWLYALMWVADMIDRMQEWNGPFPFKQLTVVDGSGIVTQDASYPGLIVMASGPIPYTRAFEQALAHQVALEWSSCATGADGLSDPATAEGPATYSAMRYMDEKYGRTSLVSNPLLSWLFRGLSSEYYNKVYYYLSASNRVTCSDPARCLDQVGFQAGTQSGPALLLLSEERRLGRPAFDSLLRDWMQTKAGTNPTDFDLAGYDPHHLCTLNYCPRPLAELDTVLPIRLGDHSVAVRPVFAIPSFRNYQIFYGPYAWLDAYHGLQLSAWAQGRQFYDAGPLHGRHQWTLSEIYSTHINDWHSSFNYQTPLSFISDRLRLYAAFDYSKIEDGAKLYFSQELGPVFRQPKTTIDFGYRFLDVNDDTFRDPRAWDTAQTADIRLRIAQSYESRLLLGSAQLLLRNGMTQLGSQHDYVRLGLEQTVTWRGLRPHNVTLRAFGGYLWGTVPKQDEFYLSGGLSSNAAEPVSWGYQGWTSGQQHWHYDADVNCRGYAGEYLHGRAAYGLNTEVSLAKLGLLSLSPFLDVGNVADSLNQAGFWPPRLDAGLGLRLGPLYADFPLWRSQVEPGRHRFGFRWMLGLKLGGTLGSS